MMNSGGTSTLGRVLHLLSDREGARQKLAEVQRITNSAELLYRDDVVDGPLLNSSRSIASPIAL
jgi:hypothetical protein